MPKRAKELEPIQVRRIKKPGYHPVGGVAGLLLCVKPSGAKSWVLRYATGETKVSKRGKPYALRRDMGLGAFPDVSLSQARDRAREARDLLYRGIDPLEERRKRTEAFRAQQEARKTFTEVWHQFQEAKMIGLAKKTRQHWINSIERYALPAIGSRPVAEIDKTHIEAMLQPIWTAKPMMGKKVRQRVERILGFATAKGYREGDNPAAWRDNLDQTLANPKDFHKTTHFPSLPYEQAPAFLLELRQREGNAARALELLILTAVRYDVATGARWDEIDLKRKRWSLSAERMKTDKPHVVPLSDAAIELLERMPRTSKLIFPAPRGGQLSDASLTAVIKRMHQKAIDGGGDGWIDPANGRRITNHGFRTTFKEWATEETDVQDFISEMALAHKVGDEVWQAYKRTDMQAKRLKLMRQWSQFLGYQERGAKVAKIA